MFICLSSGASRRYRQDILRAIAMPKGSQLQFRYDSTWIAPKIRDLLSKGNVSGIASLIAYIDQHDNTKPPEIIPCRFATLTEVAIHGRTCSLILALEEFSYSQNLDAFNKEMRAASGDTLPTWQPDGTIKGHYWFETGQDPVTVVKSLKLTEWENIVAQIADRADFVDENCFYTIEGLYPVGTETAICQKDGYYELNSGGEYEARIYHFHPKKASEGTRLSLATSSQWLTFTTNPELILDSRYDLKRVRLKTGRPLEPENAVLAIRRVDDTSESELGNWEFDMLLRIKGGFRRSLVYGIGLGVLIAAPQIIAAFSNPALPMGSRTAICIASAIMGLGVGILVAFGLKKPV